MHEGHVELAGGDHAEQRVGGDVHPQADLGAGQPLAEPAQPAWERPARGGADPEPGTAGAGDRGPGLGDERGHVRDQGRARLSSERPSGVGRQPVRPREKSSAPREFSIRRNWVVNEGWLMPS